MSEKRKSASPSAIQVKYRRKTIGTEEKLDVTNRLDKGEQIVDICRNVRWGADMQFLVAQRFDCMNNNRRVKWDSADLQPFSLPAV
jgi:hypothetical protein